jgi:hypothetical protein
MSDSAANENPAVPALHPSTIVPSHRERPKRNRASARPLTSGEIQQWYVQLSSLIERRRLLVAQDAAIPRSSRRLMRVHAHSAYVARGMAWWNAMTEQQRLEALRAANTACAADAWAWRNGVVLPRETHHGKDSHFNRHQLFVSAEEEAANIAREERAIAHYRRPDAHPARSMEVRS